MSFLVNEDGIDREPTPQELAELTARRTELADQAAAAAKAKAAKDAATDSARAKLAKLGLTENEIAALVG